MSASPIVPVIHPLRILPDPSAPPEARNPGALTRLERIALAQEQTAFALTRLADRLDRIGDRIEKEAIEMEVLIANGGSLAAESAAEAIRRDVIRLSKALGQNRGKKRIPSPASSDIRRQSKPEDESLERSQRRRGSWTETT